MSESKQTKMINLVKAQYLPGKITQKYIYIIYDTDHTDCLKALSSFHTTKKWKTTTPSTTSGRRKRKYHSCYQLEGALLAGDRGFWRF